MTAFERDYSAFLHGQGLNENPFDKDSSPFSRESWTMGWDKAQRDKFK